MVSNNNNRAGRTQRQKLDEAIIERVKNEVRKRNKYSFNMCRATNVLICGASRSGKTSLFKLLADPAYCPARGTGLFSDTVSMTLRTFSLTDQTEHKVHEVVVNLIDTPGTFELKSAKEQFTQRSNDEIKNIIVNCINNEITYLNMLVLVINAMKFSEQEIESVKIFLDLFGDSKLPLLLCLTHADHMNPDKRESVEQQIKELPGLADYFSKDTFMVRWVGCVDHAGKDYKLEDALKDDYEDVMEWRDLLIDDIFKSADSNVSLINTDIYKDRKNQCLDKIDHLLHDMNWILSLNMEDVLTAADQMRISRHREGMEFIHDHVKYILYDTDDKKSIDKFHTLYSFIEQIRTCNKSDANKQALLGKWTGKTQVSSAVMAKIENA